MKFTKQISRLYASKYILNNIESLTSNLDGIKNSDDIEFVHKARVATRRIRSAIKVFKKELPHKSTKRWLNGLQNISSKLATARDLDVQIKTLNKIVNTLPKENQDSKFGIAFIELELQKNRKSLQPQIIDSVNIFQQSGLITNIFEQMNEYLKINIALQEEQPLIPPSIYKKSKSSLKKIVILSESLKKPDAIKKHHKLRISVKKLRYTIECLDDIIDNTKNITQTFKTLQDLLGDLHDCDVKIEYINEFKNKYSLNNSIIENSNEILTGLKYLEQHTINKRKTIYKQTQEKWNLLNSQNFWKEIKSLIQDKAS